MQIKDVRPESFTKQIRCDRCGRLAELGDTEFPETACLDLKAGYGSIFGDGNEVQIDLCQYCLKLTLGRWLRIVDPNQKKALIIERLRQFDAEGHSRKWQMVADESFVEPEDEPVQERQPLDESSVPRRQLGLLAGVLNVPDDFDAPLPPEIQREFEQVQFDAQAMLAAIEARNDQGICTPTDLAEHSVIKNLCRSMKGHIESIHELNKALAQQLTRTGARLASER